MYLVSLNFKLYNIIFLFFFVVGRALLYFPYRARARGIPGSLVIQLLLRTTEPTLRHPHGGPIFFKKKIKKRK